MLPVLSYSISIIKGQPQGIAPTKTEIDVNVHNQNPFKHSDAGFLRSKFILRYLGVQNLFCVIFLRYLGVQNLFCGFFTFQIYFALFFRSKFILRYLGVQNLFCVILSIVINCVLSSPRKITEERKKTRKINFAHQLQNKFCINCKINFALHQLQNKFCINCKINFASIAK